MSVLWLWHHKGFLYFKKLVLNVGMKAFWCTTQFSFFINKSINARRKIFYYQLKWRQARARKNASDASNQRSSRKAWPLITISTNSFSFSSSLVFWEGREKEKRITKVVIKSHAFMLDRTILTPGLPNSGNLLSEAMLIRFIY